MDSVGAMVLGAVALFGAGLGIGYLMFAAGGRQRAQTEELKQEFDAYRNQVNEHFAQSAEYFQTIGREYRALYEHMAAGADALCDTRGAEQRLSFDPQLVAVAEAADVEEESVTADAAETVDLQPDEAEAPLAEAEASPAEDEASMSEPPAAAAEDEAPLQAEDEARAESSTAAEDEDMAATEEVEYTPGRAADGSASAEDAEDAEEIAAVGEAGDEDRADVNVYGDSSARSAAAAAEDVDAAEAPELPEIELPDIEESPAETKEPSTLTDTAAESAAKVLVEETGTDEVRTYH